MGRLHSLTMDRCKLGNSGIAHMAATVSPGDSAPLMELNLDDNEISGQNGDQILAHLFLRSKLLKSITIDNNLLSPKGARAMAPAMANLHALQELSMGRCSVEDCAETILTSLATCPCLQSLSLEQNRLPAATLPTLTEFLKTTGKGIKKLRVDCRRLFATAGNSNDQELFFNAIANHKHVRHLGITNVSTASAFLNYCCLPFCRIHPCLLSPASAQTPL
jgi:Ran GTPase-activating protein (RanGAP) involved in mRNA processing and transport